MDLEKYKAELVPFNQVREAVTAVKKNLEAAVVTDRTSRDAAFKTTQAADRVVRMISEARIVAQKPVKEEKAKAKREYEEKIAPLDRKIKLLNYYGNDVLSAELTGVIEVKKSEILKWDQEERRRQEEERRRIEEEERRIREEQERKEREAREAEAARIRAIEAEKKKKLEEAERLKGIEAARKRKEAEDEADRKKAEEEERAAREAQERRIDNAMERSDLVDKAAGLKDQKLSGREKVIWEFKVQDIDQVPREFLKCQPNNEKIQKAVDGGVRQIPGVIIYQKQDLKYK